MSYLYDVAKTPTNIRYTSAPILKLGAETFHVHSFVVLFS